MKVSSQIKKMGDKIMFEKINRTIKNPKHLQKNIFLLYSPRKFTIEPASNKKVDTEMTAFLLRNSKGYITSNSELTKLIKPFTGVIAYGWKY